jgi:hypothetical protein
MRPALYLGKLLFVTLGLVGADASAQSNDETAVTSCSASVVLIGRVAKADYKDQLDIFNGLWELHIQVKKVIRGRAISQNIIAISAAEAQIRSDKDFIFFISRGNSERFGVLSADMDIARGRDQLKSCEFPQTSPR